MAQTSSRLENQILHFSMQGKWEKVEALWPQVVETPPAGSKFYATLAARAVAAQRSDDLRAWTLLVIEACQTLGANREIVQVCRGILHALPDFTDLRQPLLDALRAQHTDHPRLEQYLETSGLLHETALYAPLQRFLQYIQCSEGQVFQHDHWGVGKITQLDLEGERVVIEFQRHGTKPFSFAGVRDYLKRVPRNHFLAQRLLNPRGLAARADKNPAEFLKFCLAHMNHSTTRAELKDELLLGVFKEREWNRWWTRNRDLFRFDPYIGFSGSPANPRLELRTKPKPFHEEMAADLQRAENFSRRHTLVTDMIKMHEKEPISPEVAARIFRILETRLQEANDLEPARRLEYIYLIEDLAKALPDYPRPDISGGEALLLSASDPAEVIARLSVHEYQARAAALARSRKPEQWPDCAETLFLSGPPPAGPMDSARNGRSGPDRARRTHGRATPAPALRESGPLPLDGARGARGQVRGAAHRRFLRNDRPGRFRDD